MGNSQSQNYYNPGQIDVSPNDFMIEADAATSGVNLEQIPADREARISRYNKAKRTKAENLLKTLEANMKMYMIYDNYDTKNEVILKDLKKAENQGSELKKLIEDRDKLKTVPTR